MKEPVKLIVFDTLVDQYFKSCNELLKVVARSCGYADISLFNTSDLSTFDFNIHKLTGISFAGVNP